MSYYVPNPVLVIEHAASVKSTLAAYSMTFIFNGKYRQSRKW